MGHHQTWVTATGAALAVVALCLIISTAGTKSGWFTAELSWIQGSKAFSHLSEVVKLADETFLTIEFGTVGAKVNGEYTAYSDTPSAYRNHNTDAIQSGASASLAFSILGWIFALAGVVLLVLQHTGVHHLHINFLFAAVGATFLWTLLGWTIFLGVIRDQWHDIGFDQFNFPLNPSWAWAFSFLGFVAASVSVGTTFMLARASHHDEDHHHHQEGFERV